MAYDQIADENLHDLSFEALAPAEDLLEYADKNMAKRGTDEGAVEGHLGNARGEVVTALAPVMSDPRGEELLQTREGARGQHLGAQRVLLQLLEVGLWASSQYRCAQHGPVPTGNYAPLTMRYPLAPPWPLVMASPTFLSRSSFPLPTASAAAPATASALFTVVSFSNLTDDIAAHAQCWRTGVDG